jgi:hypothetical protein
MSETAESSTALITNSSAPALPKPKNWNAFLLLLCQLSLEIPLPGFTVSTLLRLAPNVVINARWLQGTDVPVHSIGSLNP